MGIAYEAAANYEGADAAVIWLPPSAKAALRGADWSDFSQGALTIEEYDIPLKGERKGDPSTSYRTYVASPFDWPDSQSDAERIVEDFLATFDLSKPGVREKHRNTERFLRRHIDEYRSLLDQQTAWRREAR